MQKKVPYVAQLGNMDCSIACMTMLFRYYGFQIASSTAKHFYSRLVGSVNSGTFECSRPYLYGFNIPGFMTGLAGIGYSLLRLLDPTLPSVLQINI